MAAADATGADATADPVTTPSTDESSLRARVLRAVGNAWLKATGWEKSGEKPARSNYVLIAAPHTSNWDFPHMFALSLVYGVKLRWMGKHTLFEPPLGFLAHALGGIPVDRRAAHGVVEQMAQRFRDEPGLVVAIPAEGTRARTDYWKSGFYNIARHADVPILLGFLDYRTKRGGFGPAIHPTGDVRADMDRIRAFYHDKVGRHPDNFGPIRLRAEDERDTPSDAPPAPAE